MYSVYMHTTPNNKKYIGITKQKPVKRWQNGGGYKNQPLMWKAIKNIGWNNITHKILFTNLSKIEFIKRGVKQPQKGG